MGSQCSLCLLEIYVILPNNKVGTKMKECLLPLEDKHLTVNEYTKNKSTAGHRCTAYDRSERSTEAHEEQPEEKDSKGRASHTKNVRSSEKDRLLPWAAMEDFVWGTAAEIF